MAGEDVSYLFPPYYFSRLSLTVWWTFSRHPVISTIAFLKKWNISTYTWHSFDHAQKLHRMWVLMQPGNWEANQKLCNSFRGSPGWGVGAYTVSTVSPQLSQAFWQLGRIQKGLLTIIYFQAKISIKNQTSCIRQDWPRIRSVGRSLCRGLPSSRALWSSLLRLTSTEAQLRSEFQHLGFNN